MLFYNQEHIHLYKQRNTWITIWSGDCDCTWEPNETSQYGEPWKHSKQSSTLDCQRENSTLWSERNGSDDSLRTVCSLGIQTEPTSQQEYFCTTQHGEEVSWQTWHQLKVNEILKIYCYLCIYMFLSLKLKFLTFSFHSPFVRNKDFKYSCFVGLVAIL